MIIKDTSTTHIKGAEKIEFENEGIPVEKRSSNNF